MRLISSDAVIKAIDKHTFDTADGLCLDNDITCILEEVPTIEERKKGKWIRTGRKNVYGGYELVCSVCGDSLMVQHIERELYCRNCGARMEE